MEIRERSFNFSKVAGSGPQNATATLTFPRAVRSAAVGILGYSTTFEDPNDHHFGRLIVELRAEISDTDPNSVVVNGGYGLRDWSGEWDDNYSGNIQYVVLAELEAISIPGSGDPRGDLIITDAEFTQVIQHFRSDQHLDSVNVFPDNSIRMVAGKPTAVRLYSDYDSTSGLSLITQLSGSLEVTAGGATQTITPLQNIVPRRDNQIDRRIRDHTLNFIIPEALCQGTISLQAKVFDASDPSKFSRTFLRDITFDTIPPLQVLAVGVEYTGSDIVSGAPAEDLAAPTMTDFIDTLATTELLYPIPEIAISNYITITYDKKIKSDINSGCDKMGDLKDAVADMRGDSDDIVYGLFNVGLDTGSVGGCGGGGAGVGRMGNGSTAAHEIAHALGRHHAPCDNVTRCATPRDTDDNYPRYSGYDSDSIGEYGFDTSAANGRVLDPANAHDIMGYSGNRWISPYTYKALMSRIPERFGSGDGGDGAEASSAEGLHEASGDQGGWIRRKTPHLFLHVTIHRDRRVDFREAFHFPVFPRGHGYVRTDFVVELLDAEGGVLRSARLYSGNYGASCSCGCGGSDWPKVIDQAVAFDPKAVKLVLYECDKIVFEKAIPAPPTVKLHVEGVDDLESRDLIATWEAQNPSNESADIWYLVQWRDIAGTWRGCNPRTQSKSLQIPKRLFAKQKQAVLRVLATSGIATGEGRWQGKLTQPRNPRTEGGDLRVHLAGVPVAGSGTWALPAIISVSVIEPQGATIARARVRWYDNGGNEVGRGRSFDLRNLSVGFHALRAVVFNTGYGEGNGQWLIERNTKGFFQLHRGNLKFEKERCK